MGVEHPVALCSFPLTSQLSPHQSLSRCEPFSSRRPGGRLRHQHEANLHTDSFPGPNCTCKAVNKFHLVQITEWGQSPEGTHCRQGQGGRLRVSSGLFFPRHHGVSSIFLPHLLTGAAHWHFSSAHPPLWPFQPHCSLCPNFRSAYFSVFLYLTVLVWTLTAPDFPTWLHVYVFLVKQPVYHTKLFRSFTFSYVDIQRQCDQGIFRWLFQKIHWLSASDKDLCPDLLMAYLCVLLLLHHTRQQHAMRQTLPGEGCTPDYTNCTCS